MCTSHLSNLSSWIYQKEKKLKKKTKIYMNILKLILQDFLWKFNLKSQIDNFLLKKVCDEFGMICTMR